MEMKSQQQGSPLHLPRIGDTIIKGYSLDETGDEGTSGSTTVQAVTSVLLKCCDSDEE